MSRTPFSTDLRLKRAIELMVLALGGCVSEERIERTRVTDDPATCFIPMLMPFAETSVDAERKFLMGVAEYLIRIYPDNGVLYWRRYPTLVLRTGRANWYVKAELVYLPEPRSDLDGHETIEESHDDQGERASA